ncbi:MAG: endonuclease/exonuclease/phosphatase family protein [Proteobacteria bacterium]|nr:endonuclease/exonuclease/phosphatase family protein [Pseudomonadota bacterium]MBU1715484.1 endonuclease/exonuclease/phosphatase family protein [Pseudomonadota bacterium]
MKLRIATYNIHKGFSHFNRRMMVHELRRRLRILNADLVFLQEVHGENPHHALNMPDWPTEPQYEFLADQVWPDFAYGRNAVYEHGDHGNAILSRYPIVSAENQDISDHRFEQRGLLHCEVAGETFHLHCLCVHLGLLARGRRRQLTALIERVQRLVPSTAPLIVAGDFNDWHNKAGQYLLDALGITDVFHDLHGRAALTYPSGMPLLRLDRIYARGFRVCRGEVHHGKPWSRISDHAVLSAELEFL